MSAAWPRLSDLSLVAFDADDTLWHHERFFQQVAATAEEVLSRHADPEHLHDRLRAVERRNLAVYGYGVKGYGLSLIETAVEVSDGAVTGDEIRTLLDLVRSLMTHPIDLLPGVTEALDHVAAHLPVAVITKGDLFHQEAKLASSGLADRFDQVAIVSEKDPATYADRFAAWGVEPSSVLMIGNSVPSDIEPVLAIGGHAVHISSGHDWDLELRPLPQGALRLDHLGLLPTHLV